MIIMIGNAPSSGSTLLADLLDSALHFACGTELNLFSHRKLYEDFLSFRKDPLRKLRRFPSPCCYKRRGNINYHRLEPYDLTIQDLDRLIKQSNTFSDLIYQFKEHYMRFRGKDKKVWVEKTPENIHSSHLFLNTFEDGYFLHIVRDPSHLFLSLKNNRHFPLYMAASVWTVDVAATTKVLKHPRTLLVRYEDLVRAPFEITCSICARLGYAYKPTDLKQWYEQNTYRRHHSKKLKHWTFNQYGKVGNANRERLITKEDAIAIEGMFSLKVNQAYGLKFRLPESSCYDLAREYGYGVPPQQRPMPRDMHSVTKLSRKFGLDLLAGDAKLSEMPCYLKPTVSDGA